jgi:uncharacterized protein
MAKQHYFFKLIPPRATFPYDITEAEKRLMDEHSRYFDEQFAAGKLLIYGPVLAPGGAFGMAVLELDGEEEVRQFGENDPSVKCGLNRFEFYSMRVSASRSKQS